MAPAGIPRSTSIDSMVDLVWSINDNNTEQEQCNSKNLTVSNETPSRRESLLSPRKTVSKQIRGINGEFRIMSRKCLLNHYLHIVLIVYKSSHKWLLC